MKKRRDLMYPGVVVGLFGTLLAYDLRIAGSFTRDATLQFWLIGFLAPLLGCFWVGRVHRSEGRGLGRSAGITLLMGFVAGNFVFPIIGGIVGAIYTMLFILPPTLYLAFVSLQGFRNARENTIARTIWWRRRWHATIGMCASAMLLRLYVAPATDYVIGMSLAIAIIAALCLWSLYSMANELERVLAGDVADPVDLGVGEAVVSRAIACAAGPYRTGSVPLVIGDAKKVSAMMRHTLWGAMFLVAYAAMTFVIAVLRG